MKQSVLDMPVSPRWCFADPGLCSLYPWAARWMSINWISKVDLDLYCWLSPIITLRNTGWPLKVRVAYSIQIQSLIFILCKTLSHSAPDSDNGERGQTGLWEGSQTYKLSEGHHRYRCVTHNVLHKITQFRAPSPEIFRPSSPVLYTIPRGSRVSPRYWIIRTFSDEYSRNTHISWQCG